MLHYAYHCSQPHRNNFEAMLTKKMGEKYDQSDSQLYNKLEKLQPQAIKLATKLWNSHDQNTNLELHEIERLIKKHNINPSTTVYKLVEKLIEYLK